MTSLSASLRTERARCCRQERRHRHRRPAPASGSVARGQVLRREQLQRHLRAGSHLPSRRDCRRRLRRNRPQAGRVRAGVRLQQRRPGSAAGIHPRAWRRLGRRAERARRLPRLCGVLRLARVRRVQRKKSSRSRPTGRCSLADGKHCRQIDYRPAITSCGHNASCASNHLCPAPKGWPQMEPIYPATRDFK